MRSAGGTRAPGGESGRGFIGFLIAIIVVAVVGYSLKQVYAVTNRHDEFDSFAKTLISEATRKKLSVDDVRFAIVKKGRELGVPMDGKALEVTGDNAGWRLHFAYDDVIALPGYSYTKSFTIDHTWKNF